MVTLSTATVSLHANDDGQDISRQIYFRQTDLAPLPKDWDLVRLGDVCEFQNGVNADAKAYGKGVPFANVLEVITNTFLNVSRIPGRVEVPKATINAFRVLRGDILFNRTSETLEEVGLTAVYLDDTPVVFGGFVVRGRLQAGTFDSTYLGYALRSRLVRMQIASKGQGAVRANISQAELRNVRVPSPPDDEQRGIARALSDADALVESVERLVEKKRLIKQGAMQNLLSGRRRLPGFTSKWTLKRLEEIADVRSGGTPSTTNPAFWDGPIPWCTPTDITALSGSKYILHTARNISESGLEKSSAELIPENSVVMTTRATIGECAINKVAVTTNQGFKNLIPYPGTDCEFLYYLMKMQRERLMALCGGSTFLEIGKRQLSKLEITLPGDPMEQKAIGRTLADMDAELEALELRRKKARQIKQGMMQELLTGRVRLV